MIYVLILLTAVLAFPFLRESVRKPMDRAARRNAEGGFARLSRGVTHYEWIGPVRGPAAVCVHGLTTPSFVWRGLAAGLAGLGYRVLVYDLYGRGFSDRPPGAQNADFFCRQLNDLLQDQKVTGDFTLVGYSMGGAIATAFTAAHPERVRQLVLLAPAGISSLRPRLIRFIIRTPVFGDWLMLAQYPRRHRQVCEAERALPSSVEGIVDLQLRELEYRGFVPAVLASLRGLLAAPLEAEHRAIHAASVPVVAIWGRDDVVIPLSAMGQLAQWNRDVHQEVIDGAGHGLTYTHTDQILDVLRGIIREWPT